MLNKLIVVTMACAIALSPSAVGAIVVLDTVSIDGISVPTCGEQLMTFTGSATYSEGTQHLVVDLDGTQLMDNHDEPANWSVGPTTVGVGSHTLTATIYDKSDHETVMAQDTAEFTVAYCDAAEGDEEEDEGGPGDEQDCCPGPDQITPTKDAGKIKGAAKGGLPESLKPLNSIFRSVYGRDPTFEEWSYWADRLLGDKPQYDALYGAMQWHQLRGRTIGDPVL